VGHKYLMVDHKKGLELCKNGVRNIIQTYKLKK